MFLTTQTHFNHCKREMLYKKWTEQVFVPLYSSLTTCLDSVHIQNDVQRRELFDQFLKKKVTLSLCHYDIIDIIIICRMYFWIQ